jgi:hypothetical protein
LVAERPDWEVVLNLLSQGYFSPISDDDVFELFSLVRCLETLEHQMGLGSPAKRGLIAMDRGAVAEFLTKNGGRLAVYFDQSPSSILPFKSEYLRIAKAYDLGAQERRPDITLVYERESLRRVFFLEMKASNDDRYGRDSVYKGLAYLNDFSYSASEACWPKAAIVFPNIERPAVGFDESKETLVLIDVENQVRLGTVLKSLIQ